MNESNTPTIDLFSTRDSLDTAHRLRTRLRRWRLTVRKYWWLVPLIAAPLVGAAWFYSTKAPTRFESKAKMWVTGKLNFNEGKLYTEDLGNFIGTQSELLRSKTVQNRALARVAERFPEYAHVTNFPFKLKVNDSAKSSVFELSAMGREAEPTRLFLSSVMDEYLAFKRETRESTSGRTLESAHAQLRELENDLKIEKQKMYAFQQSNSVVFLKEQDNTAGNYLASINKQLALLRTEYQLLELIQPEQFIEMAKGTISVPTDEKVPGQTAASDIALTMAALQADYLKASQQRQLLKAKQKEFAQFLRPAHPKMVQLSEDIATQERLIEIFKNESAAQLASRKDSIRLQIKNLESASGEWDVKAVEASRKMTELEQIRQNVEQMQASHERLMGVIQTVDMGKSIGQENVGIVEPASAAEPLNPTVRNLALAIAASMMIGFASLYSITVFDDRFTSANELSARFDEPIIGQIPQTSLRRSHKLQLERTNRRQLPFLEAFRNIRSSLYFGDGSERPRSIVITSSIPEEGKSTVAAYLATMLAVGGSRVLLMDADLRQRVLHKFFDRPAGPGLAEILDGKSTSRETITETSIANLHLLPAGNAERHPGELLLSPRLDELIAELYPRFDFIVVDSSPVLAADDTTTLAPKMDCVLFVVRAVFTSGRLSEQGLALLRQRGVKILGLIFNRADGSVEGHHGYHRYHNYYKHTPNVLPMGKHQPA